MTIGIYSVVFLLFGLVIHILSNLHPESPYQAKFIPEGDVLSLWNKGFYCTGRRLTIKESFAGLLVVGAPGTGKTASTIFPFLYKPTGSVIVLDPSGELWNKTSGSLQQAGYALKRLSFTKPFGNGYNPLKRCTDPSSIRKVASMLYKAKMGKKSKDPFWDVQGQSLLALLIEVVMAYEPKYQNLFNVFALLDLMSAHPEALDEIVVDTNSDRIFTRYKAFLSYDSKLRSNIVATTRAALIEFGDPELGYITSFDTLDLGGLRTQKTALFVSIPVLSQEFYASLVSVFFEQVFAALMKEVPPEETLPVFVILEEAGILHLPTLPAVMSNCRKFRVAVSIVIQDESQLEQYGPLAKAIIGSCHTKIYFTNQRIAKAKELEQVLGKREYEDEHGRRRIEPLMTADAIRTLDTRYALMMCGHHRVSKIRLQPYYTQQAMRELSELPPIAMQNEHSETEPPLLSKRHAHD